MHQAGSSNLLPDKMLERLTKLIDVLEGNSDKLKYINTFLLTNWSYNMFHTGFLTKESSTYQNLPQDYSQELYQTFKSKQNPQPIFLLRSTLVDILKDYKDYVCMSIQKLNEENLLQNKKHEDYINIQSNMQQKKTSFTFQTTQNVTTAFNRLENLYNFNKKQENVLKLFKSYYDDQFEDQYEAIKEACQEKLDEISDLELEDSVSKLEDGKIVVLPEFENLGDALSGHLEDDNSELIEKCFCLESAAFLGFEKLGPLPIFLKTSDISIMEDIDTSNLEEEIASIFQSPNNYFPEIDNRHPRPLQVMHIYASEFLSTVQVTASPEESLSAVDKVLQEICDTYNEETGNKITVNEIMRYISVLHDHYVNKLKQNDQTERQNLENLKKIEQTEQERRDSRIQELVQAGNTVINELYANIDRRSKGEDYTQMTKRQDYR